MALGQVQPGVVPGVPPWQPWVCACGWSNRAQNSVCGNGRPGYGCGKPRQRYAETVTLNGVGTRARSRSPPAPARRVAAGPPPGVP